jgi:dCMP deaminase
MRPTREAWAMGVAKLTAQRATCLRRAVGAVFLNARGHIIATGYNGKPAGLPHCNEVVRVQLKPTVKHKFAEKETTPWACPAASALSGTNLDGCHAVHAEQNALLQCCDVYSIETAYVTTAPCMTCTKLLLNTSCKEIVYKEDYPQAADAKHLWKSANRIWRQYSES